MDVFEREQKILDEALRHLEEDGDKGGILAALVREYGLLLRQFRRVTKLHDKITVDMNKNRLELLSQVNYDVLTGICNRRYMEENLTRIIRSLSRSGGKLSILMMDIDRFKDYNDTYGHSVGDVCLKSIAEALDNCMKRADDFVARYGGEEFIAVLPYTDEEGAKAMAERLIERVRGLRIPHEKIPGGYVTISVGGTTGYVEHTQNSAEYIKQADKALYMSKRDGRDRYTYLDLGEGL